MSNKRIAWLRLGIFLLLSFAIFQIPIFIFDENIAQSTDPIITLVASIVGYAPAIANFLTRLLTKEGFQESFLHFNFSKSWKHYLLAPCIFLLYAVGSGVLLHLIYVRPDMENPLLRDSSTTDILLTILTTGGNAILFSLVTLGEELGWRGYMMPRLEKLIGTPAAIVVGGFIWGLWHAPLFQYGYNFGTDYPCFPWAGILLMCVSCTAMNAILTWQTKRSGTIYPACLTHACNNLLGGIFETMFCLGYLPDNMLFETSCLDTVFFCVISGWFFWQCCKKPQYKFT